MATTSDDPFGAATQTLILRVPAMESSADVEAVRRIVDQVHGVALLAVDLPAQLITIELDPDAVDLAEVAAYLGTSGYPVDWPSPRV